MISFVVSLFLYLSFSSAGRRHVEKTGMAKRGVRVKRGGGVRRRKSGKTGAAVVFMESKKLGWKWLMGRKSFSINNGELMKNSLDWETVSGVAVVVVVVVAVVVVVGAAAVVVVSNLNLNGTDSSSDVFFL